MVIVGCSDVFMVVVFFEFFGKIVVLLVSEILIMLLNQNVLKICILFVCLVSDVLLMMVIGEVDFMIVNLLVVDVLICYYFFGELKVIGFVNMIESIGVGVLLWYVVLVLFINCVFFVMFEGE